MMPRIRQPLKLAVPPEAWMIGGGGRVWGEARGEDGHGERLATL